MSSGRFYGQLPGAGTRGGSSRGTSESEMLQRVMGMLEEQREATFNTMQQNEQLMIMCEKMGTEVTELKKEVQVLKENAAALNTGLTAASTSAKSKSKLPKELSVSGLVFVAVLLTLT